MQPPRLRIAFAGTPEFAAVALKALIKSGQHDLIGVFTQPDRHAGRGRKLKKSAVKMLAEEQGLKVYQPPSFRNLEIVETLRSLDLDLLVVVAFGQILPASVLETPRLGCINVHGSLLPRWRGAAPIQRAIEAGDKQTGVTIMQMAEKLDSGPMYLRTPCEITLDETAGTLHDKLATLGAESLLETLTAIAEGRATLEEQDESLVTYAEKISKAEAQIDWQRPAEIIERKIRAFNPVPVTHAELFDQNIRIWEAEVLDAESLPVKNLPGDILSLSREGCDIQTGKGILRIKSLQLPGKRRVSISDFANANPELINR